MKITSAIRKVARQNGITVSEVRAEMSAAITQAMKSEDPEAKEFWETHFQGRTPSPEEVMEDILRKLNEKNVDFCQKSE